MFAGEYTQLTVMSSSRAMTSAASHDGHDQFTASSRYPRVELGGSKGAPATVQDVGDDWGDHPGGDVAQRRQHRQRAARGSFLYHRRSTRTHRSPSEGGGRGRRALIHGRADRWRCRRRRGGAADTYVAAMNAEDWALVAQSFAEDAVRIPPHEELHRGREAIEAWLGGIEELTPYEPDAGQDRRRRRAPPTSVAAIRSRCAPKALPV